MSYHDVVFPSTTENMNVSYGTGGGPGHATFVKELASGHESRVAVWGGPKMSYSVSAADFEPKEMAELQAFYRARQGSVASFKFLDPHDQYTADAEAGDDPTYLGAAGTEDQSLGTPTNGTTAIQLTKTYGAGTAYARVRNIILPVSGTITVWKNSVELVEDTDYTVNYTTGIITLAVAANGSDSYSWSGRFYVKVRFGPGADAAFVAVADGVNSSSIGFDLVEDMADQPVRDDLHYFGGSADRTYSSNFDLDIGAASALYINTTTSSLTGSLPDASGYPAGRTYVTIHNVGSNAFTIDAGDNTVSVSAGSAVECLVHRNQAGDDEWVVF